MRLEYGSAGRDPLGELIALPQALVGLRGGRGKGMEKERRKGRRDKG